MRNRRPKAMRNQSVEPTMARKAAILKSSADLPDMEELEQHAAATGKTVLDLLLEELDRDIATGNVWPLSMILGDPVGPQAGR